MSINGHNPHNNTARWALLSNLVWKVDVFPNKIFPKPTQLVPLSSKAVPNAPCPLTSHYSCLPKGTSCVSGPAAGPTYSVTCQWWAKQHLDCAPVSSPGRNKPCMATGQKKQCWNLCTDLADSEGSNIKTPHIFRLGLSTAGPFFCVSC